MARPTKRRRSNGSVTYHEKWSLWFYRYWVGDKRKGGYAKTKAEADEKLNRALTYIADGMDLSIDPKFREYSDNWLTTKKSLGNNLAPKTIENYTDSLKRINEFIGHMKLSNIKASHLENAYREMILRGLSPATVRSTSSVFNTIWSSAFKKGIVKQNIGAIAERPRGVKRNPMVLGVEDMLNLIAESRAVKGGLIIEFLLRTGMRVTKEALDTKWHQIDFIEGTVTVGESKTDAGSFRVIPLDDELLEQLKLHQKEQESEINLDDPLKKFNPNGYVFCNGVGNKHSRENIKRDVWNKLKKSLGINMKMRIHDLRHNCGSYLLHDNVPVTVVSAWLGHADPSITMKIYAHELPNDLELGRNAMSKLSINKG